MKGQSGVAKRQRKQNDKCLKVIVRHVTIPDAEGRLSRAIDILLRVAARGTAASEGCANAKKEEEPLGQAATEDKLTGAGNEGRSDGK